MSSASSSFTISKLIVIILFILTQCSAIDGLNKLRDGDGITRVAAPGEKIFNVVNFGAKPDGKTDNVEAFMKAWQAACHNPGKTRFLVPKGEFLISAIIFNGPCMSTPNPIVFQLSGTLKASTDISMYTEPDWLLFENIDGLVILGGGTVDGQGQHVWHYNDCQKNSGCTRLPSSIVLGKVKNVSIRRITSLNPMGFHFFISHSKNIRLQRLKIIAPKDSPNTDGIHISSSDNVKVGRSEIATGDDCIGIIQGATRIDVNKVTCGPGHGISIGSLGKRDEEEDVIGVRVINCTLRGTTNGVRVKTFQFNKNVDPIKGAAFVFQDIVMDGVDNPIIINQEYCGGSSHCKGAPSKVKLSNIIFHNIVGTTSTKEAITLKCSAAEPCRNVHFSNVNLQGLNGKPTMSFCKNAQIFTAGHLFPPLHCL